jgi:excinuclease ABC subunit C
MPKNACIYLHLNQCYGPCVEEFSDQEVGAYRNEVSELLRNDMHKFKKLVHNLMINSANIMAFEQAQEYKVLLDQIDNFKARQGVEIGKDKNFDVIEYYYDKTWVSIAIINIRNGMVQNVNLSIHSYMEDYQNTILSYLYVYYGNNEIDNIISSDVSLMEMIGNVFLKEAINSHLIEYRNLESMGKDNAREYFRNNVDKITRLILDERTDGFDELKQMADNNLELIEMYDVSHIGGDAQVGVKVAYLNGKKAKKLYRKYMIKNAKKGDEYGSLSEMLDRRITRMIKEDEQFPNLIILDGGKGQMTVGKMILEKYGLIDQISLIGLVKDDNHKTRAIINKDNQEMPLKVGTKLYKFLFGIQEEVHRFAIDFHHKSRSNSMIISELDKISGLGPKRKKLLIEKFDNIENIKNATFEQLVEIGINKSIANNIIDHFGQKD